MPAKLFTPDEARRTLPLVRRVVADLCAKGRELRSLPDSSPDPDERERARQLQAELALHLHELDAIGCQYKDWDFEHGLVDFPGELDGEPVLWCWRSDEDDIAWYHTPADGFAGRTPIPPDPCTDPSARPSPSPSSAE